MDFAGRDCSGWASRLGKRRQHPIEGNANSEMRFRFAQYASRAYEVGCPKICASRCRSSPLRCPRLARFGSTRRCPSRVFCPRRLKGYSGRRTLARCPRSKCPSEKSWPSTPVQEWSAVRPVGPWRLFCINAENGETAWLDATAHGRSSAAMLDVGPSLVALPSTSELIPFEPSAEGYRNWRRSRSPKPRPMPTR